MLLNFRNFIIEEAEPQGKALKHLRHLEDNVLYDGHPGVERAANFLDDAHSALQGKNSSTRFSTKWDGAPSIVYGRHPQNGKFFVASKSAFNRNPKINFTPEDIEKNHGHAPGLVEKLKAALEHLPKVMPKNARPGSVYQGDMLYTKGDVSKKNGMHHFTPNTITYSTPEDSREADLIKHAKMGFVTHTKYSKGSDLGQMSAEPLDKKDLASFQNHPDVHHIDPSIEINPANYTPEEQREFLQHRDAATRLYKRMKPEAFDVLPKYGQAMESHVNDMIRKNGVPSREGFLDYLQNRHNKDLEKVTTDASKDKRRQAHAAMMQDLYDQGDHLKNVIDLHGHLQRAKNVLTRVMAKNNGWGHSIGGEGTSPEGVVAVNKNGDMTKFVNRDEFARQNFLKGAFQKQQAQVAE